MTTVDTFAESEPEQQVSQIFESDVRVTGSGQHSIERLLVPSHKASLAPGGSILINPKVPQFHFAHAFDGYQHLFQSAEVHSRRRTHDHAQHQRFGASGDRAA